MNLKIIIISVIATILIGSFTANGILYSQLEKKKEELLVAKNNTNTLKFSIDKQNLEIEKLRADTSKTLEKYESVNKKYLSLRKSKNEIHSNASILAKNKNISVDCAYNEIELNNTKEALDAFYSQNK